MAYQNFFVCAEKQSRKTPAQLSGKEITLEFRMRHEGQSVRVVQCDCYDNGDRTITAIVKVCDPDGNIVFNQEFTCKK